ncbi:hypothetical protein LCM00_12390 [Bacillus infantis]|uniref:hypothetical protein n=1 Tax=Bacillus infantis TaxID=324767 RepID=UPI001CD6B971|nr:hypothetical protein [Bacillus infantis]MCA1040303.1 hypothetical protein [Bacillus infantis]
MYKDLSPGVKISITKSISTSFEQYMNKISWNDEKFDLQDFVNGWQDYIKNHASWYGQLSDETKADPEFHEQLAVKINETIEKILSEEPTEEQMEMIEKLQRKLGLEYDYSCRTEAKQLIEKLQQQLQEKK